MATAMGAVIGVKDGVGVEVTSDVGNAPMADLIEETPCSVRVGVGVAGNLVGVAELATVAAAGATVVCGGVTVGNTSVVVGEQAQRAQRKGIRRSQACFIAVFSLGSFDLPSA